MTLLAESSGLIRSADSALHRPSEFDASTYYPVRPSKFTAPVNCAQGFSVKREHDIAPHIAVLLRFRGPSTIFWRISAVIVDAINRRARWARPHICKKLRERLPLWTYRYAASTVAGKLFNLWILAPLNHCVPNVVLGGSALRGVVSVFGPKFFSKTTAASGASVYQVICLDECVCTARTDALPPHSSITHSVSFWTYNGQASKDASGEVSGVTVKDNRISHAACSFQQWVWSGVEDRYQRFSSPLSILSRVDMVAA